MSALTAAALALPGVAAAEVQADALYAHYREADISGSRSATGRDAPRYTIDTLLVRVDAPLGERVLSGNLTVETMSGASPWWVQPDQNGKPVQVMSGASIREERVDVQLTYGLPLAGLDWAVSAGYSDEDDYRAVNGGIEAAYSPQAGAYTLSAGLGYSYDRLEPTRGASSPDVIERADKDSLTAYAGVSFIVDAQTTMQAALSHGVYDGYLSDPYKRAFITASAATVPDRRPSERHLWSLSAKLRHYFAGAGAALHADYRYYYDDWEIEAHSLELAWHQTLAETWRVIPALRWYSQSQAYFYAPYYTASRGDGLASSDYRLSPYGALSVRLDLRKVLGAWIVGGGIEWYAADADYALGSVAVENPGLVEYLVLNLRLGRRF